MPNHPPPEAIEEEEASASSVSELSEEQIEALKLLQNAPPQEPVHPSVMGGSPEAVAAAYRPSTRSMLELLATNGLSRLFWGLP